MVCLTIALVSPLPSSVSSRAVGTPLTSLILLLTLSGLYSLLNDVEYVKWGRRLDLKGTRSEWVSNEMPVNAGDEDGASTKSLCSPESCSSCHAMFVPLPFRPVL